MYNNIYVSHQSNVNPFTAKHDYSRFKAIKA